MHAVSEISGNINNGNRVTTKCSVCICIERMQALAYISRSPLCCYSNETRTPIANSPNSEQLECTPYHSTSYIRVRAVVRECGEGQTDTHTAVATIHFALATPHSKCNDSHMSRKKGWHHGLICNFKYCPIFNILYL